jgi:hypothetical protein
MEKYSEPLRYPLSEIHGRTDYLQISIEEYVSIKENTGSRRLKKGSGPRIYLPIPSNIQDGNSVTYGDFRLNSIAGAAVDAVSKTIISGEDLISNPSEALGKVYSSIQEGLREIKSAAGDADGLQGFATRYFTSQGVNIFGANITPNQILARQSGEILNPNLELLFGGPTLRNFRFSFNMVARSEKEGDEIKNIIRLLKKSMAPKVGSSGNTILRTPNVFELRYKQGSIDHTFLHKFKQCFLTDISVNYTGSGTYATYEDGTPVSIKMDLTFKEIEPIYDNDYDDAKGVGY